MTPFENLADVRQYILGGKGTFTVVSPSGTRFTFRCGSPKERDEDSPVFIGVLSGPDNGNHYQYLGCIWGAGRDVRYAHGRKSRVSKDAPAARAAQWVVKHLRDDKLCSKVQIWHEGSCGKCGRKLTVPESIARGMGPHCANQ